MHRSLIGIGLVGILGCWACSSSSDAGASSNDGNGDAGNASSDGGVSADGAPTHDGGASPDGGGGTPGKPSTTWGSIDGSQGESCALGTSGLDCWTMPIEPKATLTATTVSGTSDVAKFVGTGGDPDVTPVYFAALDKSGHVISDAVDGGAGVSNVTRLAANGDQHICALDAAGAVTCWGSGIAGALGNGLSAGVSGPVVVTLPAKAIGLTAPMYGTCALLESGDVYCWGNGAYVNSLTPAKVDFGEAAVALSSNSESGEVVCAILTSGTVRCIGEVVGWAAASPTNLTHLANATAVTISGTGEACGLMSDGSVKCVDGQANASDPALTESIVEIAGGSGSFIARGASGAVYAWADLGGLATPTQITLP